MGLKSILQVSSKAMLRKTTTHGSCICCYCGKCSFASLDIDVDVHVAVRPPYHLQLYKYRKEFGIIMCTVRVPFIDA